MSEISQPEGQQNTSETVKDVKDDSKVPDVEDDVKVSDDVPPTETIPDTPEISEKTQTPKDSEQSEKKEVEVDDKIIIEKRFVTACKSFNDDVIINAKNILSGLSQLKGEDAHHDPPSF